MSRQASSSLGPSSVTGAERRGMTRGESSAREGAAACSGDDPCVSRDGDAEAGREDREGADVVSGGERRPAGGGAGAGVLGGSAMARRGEAAKTAAAKRAQTAAWAPRGGLGAPNDRRNRLTMIFPRRRGTFPPTLARSLPPVNGQFASVPAPPTRVTFTLIPKFRSVLLWGAEYTLHDPCCSPSTSRAMRKYGVNYISPGLVTLEIPRASARGTGLLENVNDLAEDAV